MTRGKERSHDLSLGDRLSISIICKLYLRPLLSTALRKFVGFLNAEGR
ncbi:hypothetical protein [Fischerella sp. JS2]|nr:hypothetical protein [Fischerella sp. JS2]